MNDARECSYHTGTNRISSSGVKIIRDKSPAHYYARYSGGATETYSRPLVFGQALHCLVLEGQAEFDKSFGVAPAHPGTKKYEEWKKQTYLLGGLKPEDMSQVMRLRDALYLPGSESARLLKMESTNETAIKWKNQATGAPCKAMPDFLADNGSIMLDLKSTADASIQGIKSSIRRYSYDLSAAMYLEGVEAVYGMTPRWGWLFVEKETFATRIVWASDLTIETGKAKLDNGLATYAECLAEEYWPGYPETEI